MLFFLLCLSNSSLDLYFISCSANEEDVKEGEEVRLDGEESPDPNGYPLSYLWTVMMMMMMP
jgi:hypothetical protein